MGGLILLLLMLAFILLYSPKKPKKIKAKEIKGKCCPLHQWEYHHVKNQYGEMVWIVVCDICKKRVGQL